jgi:hypothetical protein
MDGETVGDETATMDGETVGDETATMDGETVGDEGDEWRKGATRG